MLVANNANNTIKKLQTKIPKQTLNNTPTTKDTILNHNQITRLTKLKHQARLNNPS